jgi:hypothetical protein
MFTQTVPNSSPGAADNQRALRLEMAKQYRRMMERISDPKSLKDQTRLVAADAIIQQYETSISNATAAYHPN